MKAGLKIQHFNSMRGKNFLPCDIRNACAERSACTTKRLLYNRKYVVGINKLAVTFKRRHWTFQNFYERQLRTQIYRGLWTRRMLNLCSHLMVSSN